MYWCAHSRVTGCILQVPLRMYVPQPDAPRSPGSLGGSPAAKPKQVIARPSRPSFTFPQAGFNLFLGYLARKKHHLYSIPSLNLSRPERLFLCIYPTRNDTMDCGLPSRHLLVHRVEPSRRSMRVPSLSANHGHLPQSRS